MPRATREWPMWQASATEQASRSSLGTTRVLPVRTAARGLVQAGASAATRIYGSSHLQVDEEASDADELGRLSPPGG